MMTEHIELLVEEPSMEAFLRALLPRVLGEAITFEIYPYQGKADLLGRLEERLRGYAAWLPAAWRIIVLVDRDDDDCLALKSHLEGLASNAALLTRISGGQNWQISFRLPVEELEAWFFGDWEAVRSAYPRASKNVSGRAAYRNCDQILGGTWEAFEREMQRVGYFAGGLQKIEAARSVGKYFESKRCTSPSYRCFERALAAATSQIPNETETPV